MERLLVHAQPQNESCTERRKLWRRGGGSSPAVSCHGRRRVNQSVEAQVVQALAVATGVSTVPPSPGATSIASSADARVSPPGAPGEQRFL